MSKEESRNLKIYEMHQQLMTNAAIAQRVGLSPERVRQIILEVKKSLDV